MNCGAPLDDIIVIPLRGGLLAFLRFCLFLFCLLLPFRKYYIKSNILSKNSGKKGMWGKSAAKVCGMWSKSITIYRVADGPEKAR